MVMSNASPGSPVGRRYVRAPQPLVFPVAADVPETGEHALACADLFTLVRAFVGPRGAVGSDQFVYWDPSDPGAGLAPDLIVRMGAAPELFPVWKTWERGAPHVGVEIVSAFDAGPGEWDRKLGRYRRAGFAEVVRFDPKDPGRPLRLWDLLDGDLVEVRSRDRMRGCRTRSVRIGAYARTRSSASGSASRSMPSTSSRCSRPKSKHGHALPSSKPSYYDAVDQSRCSSAEKSWSARVRSGTPATSTSSCAGRAPSSRRSSARARSRAALTRSRALSLRRGSSQAWIS